MKTGKIVKTFLPGPEGLSFRKERVLTLRLDEPTLAELKEVADNKGLGLFITNVLTQNHVCDFLTSLSED